MSLNGMKSVQTVILTFFLIGIMTALWRAAGTIPYLVFQASKLICPSVFLLMVFILNSLLSFLTGTSFGTSATIGVICASIGQTLGFNPALTGGAILSGAFFGDRCSPVSTSALLVSALTGTDIYNNIHAMLKSCTLPFIISCVIYLTLGLNTSANYNQLSSFSIFSTMFVLNWVTTIPALAIFLLSLFRANVKLSMITSIFAAAIICIFVQKMPLSEILRTAIIGFHPINGNIEMISGGGLYSMIRVTLIVLISSSYTDILNKTGLLDGLKSLIFAISQKTTKTFATFIASCMTASISCNQTLTILLTNQLSKNIYNDKNNLALDLENSAVVIAPLVPWSIAGAVPLATIGAPHSSILFSFYLILIPLFSIIHASVKNKA